MQFLSVSSMRFSALVNIGGSLWELNPRLRRYMKSCFLKILLTYSASDQELLLKLEESSIFHLPIHYTRYHIQYSFMRPLSTIRYYSPTVHITIIYRV